MKRKSNHREHGFALVSTLALLVVLSLLIASAVALTQYLTAEVDTFDNINRSFYTSESAINRAIVLLAQDRTKHANRSLGTDTSSTDTQERFLADGRIHTFDIYGNKVSVQIFDAMRGIDVSGNNPARQLSFATTDSEKKEQLEKLSNRLNDYVDADDLVRLDSLEATGYENRNLFNLPRNRAMQFKEELRWIPGFKKYYPLTDNGYWSCFRVIAPDKLRMLSGRPNLYSTPLSVLIERCAFNERDVELLKNAFEQWQANCKDLSQTLPPTLYAKLKSYFSTMESGVYTILVSGTKDSPGSPMAATLLIDISKTKLEFYEYVHF